MISKIMPLLMQLTVLKKHRKVTKIVRVLEIEFSDELLKELSKVGLKKDS